VHRALLVANPSASGFTGARYRAVSASLARSYDLETVWPESPEGSRKAAGAAAESGLHAVFAMGGDGVVHHVASGLIGTDTALGIVPAGTTNVLARILGLPSRPDTAAAAIAGADAVALPTARIDWEAADGPRSRHALFSLGLGFDADVVERAEQRPFAKLRFGSLHYARTTISTVIRDYRRRPATISVATDGQRTDAVTLMIQIHDAYTYLGRLPLRLGSAASGLVALTCAELTVTRGIRIFGRAAVTGSAAHTGCDVFEDVQRLEGHADPAVPAQADGESLGPIGAFSVAYEPDALTVLVPNHDRRAS
jgi:diacylglycerol kinase family enzyme